jgi:hypothetical protein
MFHMCGRPYKAKSTIRRCFQFRLSTWFVLVAIMAWTMAEWPWVRSYSLWSGYVFVKPLFMTQRRLNPALLYPALALAMFVVWKVAWLFVGRRRKLRATH